MKRNDGTTLAAYDAFFARQDLIWVELNKDVVELAAAIREAWASNARCTASSQLPPTGRETFVPERRQRFQAGRRAKCKDVDVSLPGATQSFKAQEPTVEIGHD